MPPPFRFENDLLDLFETARIGFAGENMFATTGAHVPNLPAGSLVVTVQGGASGQFIQNVVNGPSYLRPSGSVTVRADDYDTAYAMALEAWAACSAVRNQFIGDNWYLWIRPIQSVPFDFGIEQATGQRKVRFTLNAYVRPNGDNVTTYELIEDLGGNSNSFISPAVADAYPTGLTLDKFVPNSVTVSLNRSALVSRTLVLEATARVDQAGGRVKLGLFNLTDAPNTPVVEIEFSDDETIGERLRSDSFDLPTGDKDWGVRITTDDTTISGAAWGIRLLRVS